LEVKMQVLSLWVLLACPHIKKVKCSNYGTAGVSVSTDGDASRNHLTMKKDEVLQAPKDSEQHQWRPYGFRKAH
jgi:hypothetical protein